MKEIRCNKCNKKLGMIEGSSEIKCPRCGEMNVTKGERQMKKILINYENQRQSMHEAIDSMIEDKIKEAKAEGLKSGCIICTSIEEYEHQ